MYNFDFSRSYRVINVDFDCYFYCFVIRVSFLRKVEFFIDGDYVPDLSVGDKVKLEKSFKNGKQVYLVKEVNGKNPLIVPRPYRAESLRDGRKRRIFEGISHVHTLVCAFNFAGTTYSDVVVVEEVKIDEADSIEETDSIETEATNLAQCKEEIKNENCKVVENSESEIADYEMSSPGGNEYEYVDLGLSAKWATMNVGAAKISDYGDYFAWGETCNKDDYTWGDYKYGVSADSLTKYNYDDNIMSLEVADDAARTNWGGDWRIPSKAEWEELCNRRNCAWEWTSVEGIPGYMVTSKIPGYTDKSIFLPAAGYFRGLATKGREKSAYYWSSTRNEPFPERAICLYFAPNFIGTGNNKFRNGGFTVRPVK